MKSREDNKGRSQTVKKESREEHGKREDTTDVPDSLKTLIPIFISILLWDMCQYITFRENGAKYETSNQLHPAASGNITDS